MDFCVLLTTNKTWKCSFLLIEYVQSAYRVLELSLCLQFMGQILVLSIILLVSHEFIIDDWTVNTRTVFWVIIDPINQIT